MPKATFIDDRKGAERLTYGALFHAEGAMRKQGCSGDFASAQMWAKNNSPAF
jgi:hypothetical protein